jgi:hypothetical protein
MASRSLYDTGWYPLDPTQRIAVIKVIADHHKITQVDLLLKTDQDSSFPSTYTYRRLASDLSLTYFVDGYAWNFEDLKDAQWYRFIFYGESTDEPTNYIHNISVKTVAKAPRI